MENTPETKAIGEYDWPQPKTYACEATDCRFTFKSQEAADVHSLKHSKPRSDKYSDFIQFHDEAVQNAHKIRKHDEVNTEAACSQCPQDFPSALELAEHISGKHTSEGTAVECPERGPILAYDDRDDAIRAPCEELGRNVGLTNEGMVANAVTAHKKRLQETVAIYEDRQREKAATYENRLREVVAHKNGQQAALKMEMEHNDAQIAMHETQTRALRERNEQIKLSLKCGSSA